LSDESIDVAIVGGGVSGVYSAWRLKQAQPNRNIVVFEGSGHIGGRLLSVRPPGIPDMVAELGGMRILPAVQPKITRLIEVLNEKLPPSNQIKTYDFPVDQAQNLAYLRGTYLRLSDFTTEPDKVPYRLPFLERGNTAGSLITNAIAQIVPGITESGVSEEERRRMAREASFAGKPLWQQGFWNVLMRVISSEGYQFGVDAGGYSSTLLNWNAADAIPWYLSDFGVAPKYKGFKNGFQQIPDSLAHLFTEAGGQIRLNTRVEGFAESQDGFELLVLGKKIHAKSLILAMPRRSLELLSPKSPSLQQIARLISAVTPQPLFKLFTTYENPWWLAAGYSKPDGTFVPVKAGRSVTDLPVRQTYYWPKQDGTAATSGPSMLLASYDDGANIGFWDGLRPRRREAWMQGREVAAPAEPFKGDESDSDSSLPWSQYRADVRMVAEVTRQLGLMHGLSYTPRVHSAAFRDWGDDPFGGGWNSWNIGVKSWDVKTQIIQPIENQPLFICGEAYSDAQGWVEGALQTADMMLEKFHLGVL